MIELGGCRRKLLDDVDFISRTIRAAAAHAGLTQLGELKHRFSPQGVTALALLAESHLSVHTWPEHAYAAGDLFTCGDTDKARAACQFIVEAFGATWHTIHSVRRGLPPPPAHLARRRIAVQADSGRC